MNRRYLIAGLSVVAVAGLWFMYNQSQSGGGSAGTVASTNTGGPQTTGITPAGQVPVSQLYGATTATTPSAPAGTLGSLITFGRPRDAFVQIIGAGTTPSSAQSTASTSTTATAPIQLGSGPTSAVPGGAGVTTPTTPVTATAPTGQTLAAEFDINGEPVVAYLRDAIPPETQQFTVKSMTSSQVVLGLNGALLANGASTVTIKVGQTLTLADQTANTTTVIHLLSVHPA